MAVLRLWKSMRFCLAWANGVEHLPRPYKECQRGLKEPTQKNRQKNRGNHVHDFDFCNAQHIQANS